MAEKSITDIFNNLKTGIVGTKTAEIDKQIDNALKSIQSVSSTVERNKYMDTLTSLVSSVGGPDQEDILKDVNQTGGVDSFQQGARLQRYKEYEAIVANISYTKRALQVLVDNILSPDDITKRILQVITEDDEGSFVNQETQETIKSRIHDIKKRTNIEKHVDKLVNITMKKGDYFVEILHSPKGERALTVVTENLRKEEEEIPSNKQFLEENFSYNEPISYDVTLTNVRDRKQTQQRSGNIVVTEYHPMGSLGGALGQRPPIVTGQGTGFVQNKKPVTHTNYDAKGQSKDPNKAKGPRHDSDDPYERQAAKKDKFKNKYKDKDLEDDEIKNGLNMKDIFLAFHKPSYVIRLETERFRTCLGYLVFPKVDFAAMHSGMWSVQMNDVDSICLNIITQLQDKIQSGNDLLPDRGDLRDVVSKYLRLIKDNEDLKIRYVPPHLMSHWRINVDAFDPYGESIFEAVKFDSKLLMAMKTAKTIKTLTSATDKRIVSIETGLPRNAKNLVEMIKEGLRKRKISIDNFGSVDTIPSHVTTFEDIYIPMRDGKKFVEFDNIQFGPDPNNDTEPIKYLRDSIVANLGVPAPFVGLEENVSNRALLTVENIMFARTVIAYQREFSELLHDLFEKIYLLLYPYGLGHLDNITITFPPPKASPYEHQMEYVEQMQRIIEALGGLGVPKSYLKKKYLPDLDWDEIEKVAAEENLKVEAGEEKSEDEQFGGGYGGF
jgi:hypothetical protein